MADPASLQRLIGDLAREGTVASVDLDAGTARVQFADDLTTGDTVTVTVRGAGDMWGLRYNDCFAIEAACQRQRIALQRECSDAPVTCLMV